MHLAKLSMMESNVQILRLLLYNQVNCEDIKKMVTFNVFLLIKTQDRAKVGLWL